MSVEQLGPEDAKLVTLARSSRARTGATEGAAVRDSDGRTYTATNIALTALRLSALQAAVAMAVSSGATGLEAAARVSAESTVDESGMAAVREIGAAAPVLLAGPDGVVHAVLTA